MTHETEALLTGAACGRPSTGLFSEDSWPSVRVPSINSKGVNWIHSPQNKDDQWIIQVVWNHDSMNVACERGAHIRMRATTFVLSASEGDSDIPHLRAQHIDTYLGQHRPWILYYQIKCSNWKAIQEVFDPWGRFQENRKKNSFSSVPSPQIPVWVTGGVWQCSYNCWNADKSLHCFISWGN